MRVNIFIFFLWNICNCSLTYSARALPSVCRYILIFPDFHSCHRDISALFVILMKVIGHPVPARGPACWLKMLMSPAGSLMPDPGAQSQPRLLRACVILYWGPAQGDTQLRVLANSHNQSHHVMDTSHWSADPAAIHPALISRSVRGYVWMHGVITVILMLFWWR